MLQGLRDKGSEGQVCRGLGVRLQVLGGSLGVPRPHPGKMLPTQPGRLPGEPLRPLGSAPDNSPLGALPRAPRTLRAAWARPALPCRSCRGPKGVWRNPPLTPPHPGQEGSGWPGALSSDAGGPARGSCVSWNLPAAAASLGLGQKLPPGRCSQPNTLDRAAAEHPQTGLQEPCIPSSGHPELGWPGRAGPKPVHEAWWGREGVGVGASSPGRVREHGEPGELRWPHSTARPGSAPAASQHGATPRLAPGAPCGEPGGGPPGDLAPSGPAAPPANRAHGPSTPDGPGGSYLRAAPAGPRSPFSRLRLGAGEQRHIQGGPGLGTGRGGPYPLPSPALPRPRSRSSPGGRSKLPEPRGGGASR